MGLMKYLNAVLQMITAVDTPYQARLRPVGKPMGRGNDTTPIGHFRPKKKKFGERKLTKKQRKSRA